MPIRLDQLTKLEAASLPSAPAQELDELVELIVKSRTPDYVPPGVKVRARIDPHLFTGEAQASVLSELEQDPEVVSLALGKKLRTIG
jgi:hypothetical protein